MKKHHYRITVEALEPEANQQTALTFNARSHDDLFAIVEKSRRAGTLSDDDSAAMAIGLKLLGEIVLEHREEPLFKEFFGHIGAFIQKLKTTVRAAGTPG